MARENVSRSENKFQTCRQPGAGEDGSTYVRDCPDAWIWCLHCQRVFQAKDARDMDRSEGFTKDQCAFEDCDGAGYQVDLMLYPGSLLTKCYEDRGETLPQVSGLKKGDHFPMYTEEQVESWEREDG